MIYYDGKSDIGYDRTMQEDAICATELSDTVKLFIVADGAGNLPSKISSGSVAAAEIERFIKDAFETDPDLLEKNPEFFLSEALRIANRVIGSFHAANEEQFSGFGAAVTACLLTNNKFAFAHCGNTRLYIIRSNKKKDETVIKQLTVDHTVGYEKVLDGKLNDEQYYIHPDRLVLTSCVGIFADPEIQTLSSTLKPNDIIVMTTKGIHYAIREEAICNLILVSETTANAVDALITAAKDLKYNDNMSAMIIWNITNEN